MDLKGWEESGGLEGMHKKGQMVPLGVGWLMGVFTEVTVGCCANKHSHNTIVTFGPCFNGGAPNLTSATLASVLPG